MNSIRYYFLFITFMFSLVSQGQELHKVLRGYVFTAQKTPIENASVKIGNAQTVSSENGYFEIKFKAVDVITLYASAIGYKDFSHSMSSNVETLTFDITLQQQSEQIATVEVLGLTKVEEVNRQAFNVTAIDATKLYNSTLDISGALDKVAGIRVRESGGLGSNFNLSLNGFSGNHIRYFIDGIPMDNLGSSFQINNIPINIAERIEVYKGVVPVWLGSDALGGAINIVTGDKYRNYIDASYSYGSFNTHRTVVNTAFTSGSGFFFQLNAFQNYSDNNYKVTVDAADINTGAYAPNTLLRRFHDTYHNESIIANVGVVDKSYADKMLFGIVLGKNYKEIQTGARMASVFGGRQRRGNTIMPTLKYRKEDLIKGLDVVINANYNLGSEQNIDTMNMRFDWFGNSKPTGTNSGESSRSLYKYKNNEGLATGTLNYRISERQSVSLNNVFSTFNREGSDQENPANNNLESPQQSIKNVLGAGYSYDIKDVFSGTAFIKLFSQNNEDRNSGSKLINKLGTGIAGAYYLLPDLQLKSSYELTNRMPLPYELFGDVENQEANYNLKPEKSNNFNLGALYNFTLNAENRFSIGTNLIYRYASDFIYNRLNNNQSKIIADNRDGVRTIGGDAEVHYSYKNWLKAGGTITYLYLQNMQKVEPGYDGISPLYQDQMPNIPFLFGNADLTVFLRNFGHAGNTLNIGYNLLYVHDFYLYWPSRGNNKLDIPRQLSHDVNLVYSLQNGKYNVALEAKNLTDVRLYDNFSLQKPSRGFYLNFRYFFNKS